MSKQHELAKEVKHAEEKINQVEHAEIDLAAEVNRIKEILKRVTTEGLQVLHQL